MYLYPWFSLNVFELLVCPAKYHMHHNLWNSFGETACKSIFQEALAAQLHTTMRCDISAYGSITLWCVIYHVSLMGRFSLLFKNKNCIEFQLVIGKCAQAFSVWVDEV